MSPFLPNHLQIKTYTLPPVLKYYRHAQCSVCNLLASAYVRVAKYSVFQKDWLNFLRLYFLNYKWYWMIYITFEKEVLNFQILPLEHSPSAVQQRQLRAKWLLCSTRIFAFVSSLKLSRRLPYRVRFVFVLTFNLKRGRAFVTGITNLSK